MPTRPEHGTTITRTVFQFEVLHPSDQPISDLAPRVIALGRSPTDSAGQDAVAGVAYDCENGRGRHDPQHRRKVAGTRSHDETRTL